MANYRGINTDPISVLAGWQEWNGSAWVAASAIPAAGDVAYANGFNKRIDQDWTVAQIRNNVFQGTTGSGRFELLDAGITFSGTRVFTTSGVRNELLYVSFGNGTSSVLGTAATTQTTNNNNSLLAAMIIEGQSGGLLVLEDTGEMTSSTGNNAGYAVSVINNGNGFVIEVLTIRGQPLATADNRLTSGMVIAGSFYIVNVLGTVQPRNQDRSTGLWLRGSGNEVNIYGTALPVAVNGPQSQAIIDTGGGNTINVYGNALSNQFGPSIVVTGGGLYPRGNNTSIVVLKGGCSVINADNQNAIRADNIQLDNVVDGDIQWQMKTPTNQDRNLYTAGLLTGYPPQADVRSGEVFGPVGEFTGTLSPVNIDVQQLASDLLTEISSSPDPLAERLRNVSTIQSTGAQLQALSIAP